MKPYKLFCAFIIFVISLPFISSADQCRRTVYPDNVPCNLILPINITTYPCTTLTAEFYNGSLSIYNQTMSQYNLYSCNSTFNISGFGTYSIHFTSGDDASVIVLENRDNKFYLYVVMGLIFVVLLFFSYYLDDPTFAVIAGFVSSVIALDLFFDGFPGLTNAFLKHSIIVVLAGVSFYYIITPTLLWMEENFR